MRAPWEEYLKKKRTWELTFVGVNVSRGAWLKQPLYMKALQAFWMESRKEILYRDQKMATNSSIVKAELISERQPLRSETWHWRLLSVEQATKQREEKETKRRKDGEPPFFDTRNRL